MRRDMAWKLGWCPDEDYQSWWRRYMEGFFNESQARTTYIEVRSYYFEVEMLWLECLERWGCTGCPQDKYSLRFHRLFHLKTN